MQNIDPLYFLIPTVVIGLSVGLVIFWHFKRRFTIWVLGLSALAYFAAIALKYAVQIPTIHTFEVATGGNLVALGIYYGLQTMIFEVGGAYVVAYHAVKRGHLKALDAEGYGLGLAFWENGVYIGVLTLIDLVSYYVILSTGSNSLSHLVYSTLSNKSPGLFFGPLQALPAIGLSILERISSLLAHFAWGYLVVLSVVYRRKIYLAIALPMGFIDFTVPFASRIGATAYELLIFAISAMFLALALAVARSEGYHKEIEHEMQVEKADTAKSSSSHSLNYMNFRRALSYGKIYVIITIALSVFYGSLLTVILSTASARSSSTISSVTPIYSQIPALLLPLFAIIGSFGSLMVFVSDKDKGVYEYLIAYGTEPSSIFWSIVVAAIGLVSIVLVISVASSIAAQIIFGIPLTITYVELISFYVLPISFSATAFGNMAGMIWSSLTKRRAGVNSPVGVAPFIGTVPILIVLVVSSFMRGEDFLILVGSVSGALLVLVAVMIASTNKLMVRERFLSSE